MFLKCLRKDANTTDTGVRSGEKPPPRHFVCVSVGGWRGGLAVHRILLFPNKQNPAPSTFIKWLTNACISSYRDLTLWVSVGICTCVLCSHREIQTENNFNGILFFSSSLFMTESYTAQAGSIILYHWCPWPSSDLLSLGITGSLPVGLKWVRQAGVMESHL